MTRIVRDEEIRSGDPRIEGTRITVHDVKRRVIDNEEDPHVVAGEYDVSMAALFRALAYYYEHRDDVGRREQEAAADRREGEKRTREIVERAASGDAADELTADRVGRTRFPCRSHDCVRSLVEHHDRSCERAGRFGRRGNCGGRERRRPTVERSSPEQLSR